MLPEDVPNSWITATYLDQGWQVGKTPMGFGYKAEFSPWTTRLWANSFLTSVDTVRYLFRRALCLSGVEKVCVSAPLPTGACRDRAARLA